MFRVYRLILQSDKGIKNLAISKPNVVDVRFNRIKSARGEMNDLGIPTFRREIVSKFQMVGLSD